MAGRTLPPKSRIFTRKKSVWSRLVGTLALTLALAVTAFGIGTAVWLDQTRAPGSAATVAAPPALSVEPAPAHDPLAADAAVPAPPPTPPIAAPALARIEPLAGPAPTAGPPAKPQSAALEPPPPAPAPAQAAAPRHPYWVEYGVFVGPRYAKRLQQALARDGLESVVVATHGSHGRKLLRVRSAPLGALADARAAAAKADRALHLAALIHSGQPEAGAPAPHYWVQFGAFRKEAQAARLQHRLATAAGLGTSVTAVRGTSGKPLFLVRSTPLATRDAAVAIAVRARPIAEVPCLVGLASGRLAARHAARAPPRSVADSR
jgi:cell division protein FtsN